MTTVIQTPMFDEETQVITVTSNRHVYQVGEMLTVGDHSAIFPALLDGVEPVTLKVAQHDPGAAALLQEFQTLTDLHRIPELSEAGGVYFPDPVETMSITDDTGTARLVTVLRTIHEPSSLSLVHQFYGDGVDPRDMAWMLRRLLMALGFAHVQGVVHAAVTPDHILLQPEQHGLQLIDWCAASTGGAPVPVTPKPGDLPFCPPELIHGGRVTPGTDIFMAVRCMRHIMRDQPVPEALDLLLSTAEQQAMLARPQDAWEFKDQLDQTIIDLWGPLQFRVFPMI